MVKKKKKESNKTNLKMSLNIELTLNSAVINCNNMLLSDVFQIVVKCCC